MARSLPPLQALRALEAASRRRSFSRAAEELHLTHSAVSHHLRALEAELGVELFRRVGSRMVPTVKALQLAEQVRLGLEGLHAALDAARHGSNGVTRLEVSVMSGFASVWLIPRLRSFREPFPDIELSLHTHSDVATPEPYSFDVGIWHRRVEAPGFRSNKLLDDQVVAVCSPELLSQHPDFCLERLPEMPLLRFSRKSWCEFFRAAGIASDEPERGVVFDDALLLLQAAVAGLGVAMARVQMARTFIERGQLVQLGKTRMRASFDYYLTWRDGHPNESAIDRFREWIASELGR